MSELKEHIFCDIDEVFPRGYCGPLPSHEARPYYLKSEADKVIAELKAQKAQAEDDCAYWKMSEGNAVNAMHETEEYAMQLYKELLHQKFKRCLAMAKWCDDRYDNVFERVLSVRDMGFEPSDELTFDLAFVKKWRKRWLELAERFKEAK